MQEIELEQSTEEMIQATKAASDVSAWKKNRKTSPLLSVITSLNQIPKTVIPTPDLSRVRNQILDRISVPAAETSRAWFMNAWPKFISLGLGTVGTLLIVVSLGLGTAVAALESVPGQTIYPLKKAVESVQLRFTPEDEKTSLKLKFANKRMDELQQILEQKEQGKISEEEAQKVISDTLKDLKVTTDDAASVAATQPKIVNKLADLGNKIKSASIQTEGDAKVELEKALEATKISQEDAIKNIENAGLQVENQPIVIPDVVTASGKLTEVTKTSISIGTSKFLLSSKTVYKNLKVEDLKVGIVVDIQGEIDDNKTYAVKVQLILDREQASGSETTNSTTKEEPTPPDTGNTDPQ